jgi:hypothetical protein
LREAALQHARHTPSKLSTSTRLHRGAWTPPPPRSHTSLLAPLEGDLPAFPTRSTSACAAPGHGHLPGPIHTRGAAPVEASGAHVLAGDIDCVDAPVERALVDGRLDAIETTRNRWCAPTVEVDLAPGLASMSAIGFSWRSDLLLVASVGDTCFVAAAFAP